MWYTTGKALLAALLYVSSINALPVPQYGPQGMGGGFGYPMNGQMMGNGNGNGGGCGPYGMGGGDSYGPMNNYNGGGGRYNNMRMAMRGQRYNAHAGPEMWPIPKNPYKAARWNRGNANGFYDSGNGGGGGGPMMGGGGPMMGGNGNGGGFDGFRGSAHNRIPMDDNDDSDVDDDKSKEDTKVAGVNRISADTMASGLSSSANENAGMTDMNTSINLSAMSDKIINIGAFDGATMKATSTAASAASSATAATTTASPNTAKKTTKPSPPNARQTVTRNMGSAKPTQVARSAAKPTAHDSHAKPAGTAGSKPSVSSVARAAVITAAPVTFVPQTTMRSQRSTNVKPSMASSTRREPSMKKIRGL
ncbi:hypothetical protein IWW38_002782 [Coemansia aciculifera]|uniref:Uncharacterized protein n=1 Tax=Coemansia aciculifera TaxID=417176 RepID=A0ACC1M2J4_9FUNG|nr:hypothetical protein IWW38_002782 [Coemansia aciculifera]